MEEKLNKVTTNNESISYDIKEMRDSIINNLVESNKKLQKRVHELENQIESLNEVVSSTNQYGRRSNVEITGIPNT